MVNLELEDLGSSVSLTLTSGIPLRGFPWPFVLLRAKEVYSLPSLSHLSQMQVTQRLSEIKLV